MREIIRPIEVGDKVTIRIAGQPGLWGHTVKKLEANTVYFGEDLEGIPFHFDEIVNIVRTEGDGTAWSRFWNVRLKKASEKSF